MWEFNIKYDPLYWDMKIPQNNIFSQLRLQLDTPLAFAHDGPRRNVSDPKSGPRRTQWPPKEHFGPGAALNTMDPSGTLRPGSMRPHFLLYTCINKFAFALQFPFQEYSSNKIRKTQYEHSIIFFKNLKCL